MLQVTAGSRGLLVNTGITDGPIWFSVGEPDHAGPQPGVTWDTISEVTMTIGSDLICDAPAEQAGFGVPVFTPTAPGPHRVAVFGWGRGNAPDQYLDSAGDPVEEYAVWIRPESD